MSTPPESYQPAAAGPAPQNGMGTAALVMGILQFFCLGIIGSILVGVFATRAINDVNKGQPVGWVDGNAGQVLTQLYGVVAIGLFCAVATWIILKLIDATIGLRVSRDEETEGLDTALHGERVQ